MRKARVMFFGINPHLQQWINHNQWYTTDKLSTVAVEVFGSNGWVIMPLKAVVSIRVEAEE